MSLEIHGVVQDAADADKCRSKLAKQDQVAGSANDAGRMTSAVATVAKVIASDLWSQIHPGDTSISVRICRQISQGRHQKPFVPQPRLLAKVLMGSCEDFDYVGFSSGRKAKLSHYPSPDRRLALRRGRRGRQHTFPDQLPGHL